MARFVFSESVAPKRGSSGPDAIRRDQIAALTSLAGCGAWARCLLALADVDVHFRENGAARLCVSGAGRNPGGAADVAGLLLSLEGPRKIVDDRGDLEKLLATDT